MKIIKFVYAATGLLLPDMSGQLDVTIAIVIAILMFSMFAQIPFKLLKMSFNNGRFMGALLTVNSI